MATINENNSNDLMGSAHLQQMIEKMNGKLEIAVEKICELTVTVEEQRKWITQTNDVLKYDIGQLAFFNDQLLSDYRRIDAERFEDAVRLTRLERNLDSLLRKVREKLVEITGEIDVKPLTLEDKIRENTDDILQQLEKQNKKREKRRALRQRKRDAKRVTAPEEVAVEPILPPRRFRDLPQTTGGIDEVDHVAQHGDSNEQIPIQFTDNGIRKQTVVTPELPVKEQIKRVRNNFSLTPKMKTLVVNEAKRDVSSGKTDGRSYSKALKTPVRRVKNQELDKVEKPQGFPSDRWYRICQQFPRTDEFFMERRYKRVRLTAKGAFYGMLYDYSYLWNQEMKRIGSNTVNPWLCQGKEICQRFKVADIDALTGILETWEEGMKTYPCKKSGFNPAWWKVQ